MVHISHNVILSLEQPAIRADKEGGLILTHNAVLDFHALPWWKRWVLWHILGNHLRFAMGEKRHNEHKERKALLDWITKGGDK